jgi:SNF2 family DNA or RNA helicase
MIEAKRARSKSTRSSASSKTVLDAHASFERQTKQSTSCGDIWRKLDTYQKRAVDFAHKVKTAALFAEQGTGKTWITLGLMERLIERANSTLFSAVLVVPLANVETTWAKLLREQLPQCWVARSVEEFKQLQLLFKKDTLATAPIVLLVHHEGLPKVLRFARRRLWSLIVYDEAHRIKSRSSGLARAAHALRHSSQRKLALTGTPMDERPTDLWSLFKFIRPELFGERWGDFERDWLTPVADRTKEYRYGSVGWQRAFMSLQIQKRKRTIDPAKLSSFMQLIRDYSVRIVASDVLDLPDLEMIRYPVRLRGRQRELYEELEKYAVSETHNLTAPFKMTLIGKLHQICGGHVIDDDGEARAAGEAKLRAVVDIVRRSRRPIVIFARYVEEVLAIRDKLSYLRVDTLTGGTPKRERSRIVERFQEGLLDILVCQIKTGGVGIDLFKSSVAIVYSCTYSHIDLDQAMKRVYRRGQRNKVQIYLVYAWQTVDEVILHRVMSKNRVTANLLNQLKRTSWQTRKRF